MNSENSELNVDYESFAPAIETSKKCQTELEEIYNKILTNKKEFTDSTFFGPIAEDILQVMDKLYSDGEKLVEDYTTIKQFLESVHTTYVEKGDNASLQAFLQLTGSTTASQVLGTSNTLETYRALAALQTGGNFVEGTYTATNGVTLPYYVYVPTFSNGQTTGLPMCVFLHGSGKKGSAMNESFPRAVKGGMNVPGILLFPTSKDNWAGETACINAAAELTRKVASDYQVDTSRISAAGHSDGGAGVHELVARNPNLFSCYISYAGNGNDSYLQAVASNKIPSWGFVGSGDGSKTRKNSAADYNYLESTNPSIYQYTVVQGEKHPIAYNFWVTPYEYNGQTITPIEWLFTTTKQQTQIKT